MSTGRTLRLVPAPPPAVIYGRAAELRRRAERLADERQSNRVLRIGARVAAGVEAIADREASGR